MRVEYHPSFVDDLIAAEDFYLHHQHELKHEFRSGVLEAIERVRKSPFHYAEVNGVRRAILRRFPFSIMFRVVEGEFDRILLLRHHKRHPAFEGSRK